MDEQEQQRFRVFLAEWLINSGYITQLNAGTPLQVANEIDHGIDAWNKANPQSALTVFARSRDLVEERFIHALGRTVDLAVCLNCGAKETGVPLAHTETGWHLLKRCDRCEGQLVSNPRSG